MPKPAKPETAIFDFPGLNNNPRSAINELPGSASDQVNACSIIQGQMEVRKGLAEVSFEDG